MPWLANPPGRGKLYVGKTLREGPEPLKDLTGFFHSAGYTVYMPYDDNAQNSPIEIKAKDMEAIKTSDLVILELAEASLGVAQELGAARALGKPVILITRSESVRSHNWVKGDRGITSCSSKEEALQLLRTLKRVDQSLPPLI